MAVVAGVATLVVAGATAGVSKKAAGGDICVLLPDTASSVRWEHFDKPALVSAFKAAKVTYTITNADNDAQKQKSQADQCLGAGAKVLIEVMLDAGSASAIEKQALAKGVPSIDYDRQVPGGVAKIYDSFDGGAVGVLQGKASSQGSRRAGSIRSTRSSPSSTAAALTRTRSCSRAATTRSSSRSTRTRRSRRAPISSCPAGTTRRPARSSSRCS